MTVSVQFLPAAARRAFLTLLFCAALLVGTPAIAQLPVGRTLSDLPLVGAVAHLDDANAGTYQVASCWDAFATQNNVFYFIGGTGGTGLIASCPAADSDFYNSGLGARTNGGPGSNTGQGGGTWVEADAPGGTNFNSLSYNTAQINNANGFGGGGCWATGIWGWNANDFYAAPQLEGQAPCFTTAFPGWEGQNTANLGGFQKIRLGIQCNNGGSCNANWSGGFGVTGLFRNMTLTLNDFTTPAISPISGALWAGGWHRGTQDAWANYTNTIGVRGIGMIVDGAIKGAQDYTAGGWPANVACNFTFLTPCHNVTGGLSLDTTAYSDGPHDFYIYGQSPGQNNGLFHQTLNIDNHAPGATSNLSVAGGETWRPTNSFSLSWANPNQGTGAPITAAHYKLCPVAGGACTTGQQSSSNIASLNNVSVPGTGDYIATVYLEDAAGNTDSTALSNPAHLRFDPTVPGDAEPQHRNGWENANEIAQNPELVKLKPGAAVGPSGVAGYAVTTDGSDPGNNVSVPADGQYNASYPIGNLPEGVTTIKARAISGAGVPSNLLGQTTIQVDKTPPTATVNAPDAGVWNRGPVTVTATGTDQPNLSGMTGADPGLPIDKGGFMTFRVDGGLPQQSRGSLAAMGLGSDGVHTVSAAATDVAGNGSAEKAVTVKIDQTAPTGTFDTQDPADPRKVTAFVFDATSGVAGGTLQLRNENGGSWQSLPTQLVGGQLQASVDDASLPQGRYAVRALTTDVAGNQAVLDRTANGAPKELDLPLRLRSVLTVGTQPPAKAKCKTVKSQVKVKQHGKTRTVTKNKRVCQTKPKPKNKATKKGTKASKPKPKKKPVVRVPANKSLTLHGQLVTGEGRAISNGVIDVLEQPTSTPAPDFRRVMTMRADANGRFSYQVPEGPSRTLRFSYEGTPTVLPSAGDFGITTSASSTLKLSPKTIRRGRVLRLSGQLAGGHVPKAGKYVVLQAVVGRRVRTFATVRSNAKGAWKATYRFARSGGAVTYGIRAYVVREVTYPFAAAYSPTVRLHVVP